jgi:carbamoyl-phosphate synthase large subunit
LGFKIVATSGTAQVLAKNGIEVRSVSKVHEGRPNIVDLIKNNEIDLIINTPTGKRPKADQLSIRSVGLMHNIPCITTISAAAATVNGIESLLKGEIKVKALQEYYTNR